MSPTPPRVPPPQQSYVLLKKAENARASTTPTQYMSAAAARAAQRDLEAGGEAHRSANASAADPATGWPVMQPEPLPPYVTLSERMRTFLFPEAISCGTACVRLPLYMCIGLIFSPLLVVLGLVGGIMVIVLAIMLSYPLATLLSWCFPRFWPGFSTPTAMVWKLAKLFQTYRASKWYFPRPGEWKQENLAEKRELSTALLHYAIAIQVPLGNEDELATQLGELRTVPPPPEKPVQTERLTMPALYFMVPDTPINDQETFDHGEDPVAYVMNSTRFIYPESRQRWPEKLTDQALTWFCVLGLGAHRLEVVTDAMRKSYAAAKLAPKSAKFVVRTNNLATLPTKAGCDSYGGDCFLDDGFNVICIIRMMPVPVYEPENYEMYFPPNSPLLLSHDPEDDEEVKPDISHMKVSVRSRACASTTSSSGAAASEASSGKRFHVAEDVDLNREWEYAKFVFRSSVFGMVTFVDHLYGLHLQVSNIFTTAMRERLPKSNPLRSFLVPFTYGAISINDAARLTLVTPNSWLPRVLPFNDEGLQLAWANAHSMLPVTSAPPQTKKFLFDIFDRGAYCHEKLASGLDTEYWRQALEYWKTVHGFVLEVFSTYWPNRSELVNNGDITAFMLQVISNLQATSGLIDVTSIDPDSAWANLTEEERWTLVTNAIATFINLVTAGHEQVGQVQVYAQDPTFAAFSWSTKVCAAWGCEVHE